MPLSEKNGDNATGSTLSANAAVPMVEQIYTINMEVGLYHGIGGIGVTVDQYGAKYAVKRMTNFKLKPARTTCHNGPSISSEAGVLMVRPAR